MSDGATSMVPEYGSDLVESQLATTMAVHDLFTPLWLMTAALAGPLLAIVAAWLPALAAAQQDPANLLREG